MEINKLDIFIAFINIFLIIAFIGFYLWYFILIMNIDRDLQFYYLQQSACNRSQLEIETVRYNTMNLHDNFKSSNEDKRKNYKYLSGLVITVSLVFIITSFTLGVIQNIYNQNIDYNVIILISSIILLITFISNNFTKNSTIKNYIDAYDKLKTKLTNYFNNPENPEDTLNASSNKINRMAELPQELISSLMKRYRSYHEVTNYLKIPFYSEFEIRNEIQKKLEKEVVSDNETKSIEINVNELMRFMKFNVNNDRQNVKSDIELITGFKTNSTNSKAADYYTLRQDTHNPYESLNKQLKANQTALWIITILIIYQIYHTLYQYQEKRHILIYGLIISLMILIVILMLVRSSL